MERRRANHRRVTPKVGGRKPYRAPRLVEYGDLRKITLAKGGNKNDDPTPPATKK
jgi:hypothetical protein